MTQNDLLLPYFGVSESESEFEYLFAKTRRWIDIQGGLQSIDLIDKELKIQDALGVA